MKQFLSILIFLILAPIILFAQTNYKKGIIITSPGDTLHGFIDHLEWIRNPRMISFKKELNAEKQEFTPENSQYFELEGMERYERFEGRITTDITELGKLNKFIDTSRVKATVFLKVLQKGKNVSLLSYRDEIKTRYFIKDGKNQKAEELILRKYQHPDNNRVGTSAIYRGQLLLLAKQYEVSTAKLQREIETANYTLPDLESIIHKINGTNKKDADLMMRKVPGIRFLAGVGLNRSNFDVKGEHLLAKNSSYPYYYSPKLVVGADAFINPNVRRLIMRGELSVTNARGNITKSERNDFFSREYSQTLKQQTISVSPQIIYNLYNGQTFKFYFGGGLSVNISSYKDVAYESKYNSQVTTSSGHENNVDLDKIWFSYPIRSGIVLSNKVDLSILYFMPTVITKYALYSYRINTIQFQVNYLINKK